MNLVLDSGHRLVLGLLILELNQRLNCLWLAVEALELVFRPVLLGPRLFLVL